MNNVQTATAILNQLGGKRFIAFTGSTNFVAVNKGLIMKLCRNRSKATHLKIQLNSLDLYDVHFIKAGKELQEVRVYNNVYCDQLEQIFCNTTGFYTKF
jgi:hypothetical protein